MLNRRKRTKIDTCANLLELLNLLKSHFLSYTRSQLSGISWPKIYGLQCVIVVFPDHTHLLFCLGRALLLP